MGRAAPLKAAVLAGACSIGVVRAQAPLIEWQDVGAMRVARTETSVGQFRRFTEATRMVTTAERSGGGSVYEAGWVKKTGWTWRTPYGPQHVAHDAEPVAHVTFGEAQAFCRWAGGRLPSDWEWTDAAYLEQRLNPPPGFVPRRRYLYPTGEQATGAQCLKDCGRQAQARAVAKELHLDRRHGHARVDATPAGVNGLHDMGGNLWEWVDELRAVADGADRVTRGGSWWYGAAQMREDHVQFKPATTTAVYVGFRCVQDRRP